MRASTTFFKALTLVLPLLGPGSVFGQTPPTPVPCVIQPATAVEQTQFFNTFVEEFYTSPAHSSIAADYIQHNPFELDGITSSFDFLDPIFSNTSVNVQILHRVFEAPYGWLHYRVDGLEAEPTAILDLFRFNGTCVQEHWDVIQERPVNSTNPHPLF
ncbi:hypothetical protein B0H11DRAFT_1984642 [Mycena galericulata]|nr:hypothetical protein B0H11DRAFT_1984642 [Mycena galericulata]